MGMRLTSCDKASALDIRGIGVYTPTMKITLIDIPNECVAYNLTKTARHVTAFYRKVISPSGLQGTQFPLLLAIKLNEPISISALAKILELDRTTLSRNIRRLQDKDYIILEGDGDQRVRKVRLSDNGKKTLNHAIPLWEKAQKIILQKFGEDNWKHLLDSMKEIEEIVG